jgi:hypothetical protein
MSLSRKPTSLASTLFGPFGDQVPLDFGEQTEQGDHYLGLKRADLVGQAFAITSAAMYDALNSRSEN